MNRTTPRVPPLARADWTDEARDVFAYWEGPPAREAGSRSNTMMTLANHPKLAIAALDLGRYFMLDSTLTARQQKMIVLRVAWRHGSTYQWAHNSISALQIGMTPDEIAALRNGPDDPVWTAPDRLLLTAIDQTGDGGGIDDDTWAAMTAQWPLETIMDVLHAIGYFTMVAWSLIAMRVQLEPDFAASSGHFGKTEALADE